MENIAVTDKLKLNKMLVLAYKKWYLTNKWTKTQQIRYNGVHVWCDYDTEVNHYR